MRRAMRDILVSLLTAALEDVIPRVWQTLCPVCSAVGNAVPCRKVRGHEPVGELFHTERMRKTVVWYVNGKLNGDS